MTFHRQAGAGVVSIRYLYHKKVPSSRWEPTFLSLPGQAKPATGQRRRNEMIIVTGRVRVHPDQREAAISAAEGMRKHTLDEPGCIDYRFWSATDDPEAILLFEQWQEQSALEAH